MEKKYYVNVDAFKKAYDDVPVFNTLLKRRMSHNGLYTQMLKSDFAPLKRFQGVKLTDYEKAVLRK